MRYFIALDIPEKSRQELKIIQQKLKTLIPEASLQEPEQLHLTIAFIGERPEELKEKLIEVMAEASKNIKPFSVAPSFIDGFPHLHTARVLWAGVKGEVDDLYILRHNIKDGLSSLNLTTDERRYVPHIALAKLPKIILTKDIEEKLQSLLDEDLAPITVSSVKLFESVPNHGLHTHNTLAEIKLLT